ncbi:unnamed protein product [Symbiodinium necroappetens]|uniref:Uncharacterized protein n=1 Tax=Symbiodinium necroappetens TaxID=1628268 RepID=A0A812YLP8_9DINO|nr:unnamed protein product [Symbiodinium necroappetens]
MHVQSTQVVDAVFFGTIIDEQTSSSVVPHGRLEENHVRSVQGETSGESMMRVVNEIDILCCVLLYGTNSCFPLGHADVQLLQAVELSLDVADSWTKLHAYGIRSILVEGEDPFIKIGETIVQIAFWLLELARIGTQQPPAIDQGMRIALGMVLSLAPDGLVLNFMNVGGNVAKSWVGDGFSMVSISGDSMDDATWCTITKEEDFGTVAAKLDSLVRTNYRIYTATFGKNLLKAYTSWLATPAGDRADLRGREVVDLSLSDREIFEGLQGEDEWIESGMHEVFEYLYRGTRLVCWDLTVSAKSSLQCRHRPV